MPKSPPNGNSKTLLSHTFHVPIPLSPIIFCNNFSSLQYFKFYTLQSKNLILVSHSNPKWHISDSILTPIWSQKHMIFFDKKKYFQIPVNLLKSRIFKEFSPARKASPDIHNTIIR